MTAPALPPTQLVGRALKAVGWSALSGALGIQFAKLLAVLLPASMAVDAAFAFVVFAGLRLVAEGNGLDPARHRRSPESPDTSESSESSGVASAAAGVLAS